jgi:hypothetical protein
MIIGIPYNKKNMLPLVEDIMVDYHTQKANITGVTKLHNHLLYSKQYSWNDLFMLTFFKAILSLFSFISQYHQKHGHNPVPT